MSNERVLAVTSQQPWPLNSGGHLRTYHLLNALAKECDVRLVFPVDSNSDFQGELGRRAQFECCPITVPRRTVTSEAARWLKAQTVRKPYAMYRRHDRPEIHQAIASQLKSFDPDVLWLDHLDSFLYRPKKTRASIVLDLHNIYSLILDRLADESSGAKQLALRLDAGRLRSVEKTACNEVDLICSVSQQEANHFETLGAKRVALVPNGVDCQGIPTREPATTTTPRLLFLGAMDWTPNVSAAKFLAIDLLPILRQQFPDIELDLVGRNPASEVLALADRPGVNVTGTVPEVAPYLNRATLFVVPLDSGGGTRLKILEAFASGVPVVSTPVGVEGIDATDGKHLRVLEREQMAAGIVEILKQDRLSELATQARRLVEDHYDWERIGASAIESLRAMLENCSLE